ncbi:hypothetical protein D3C71_1234610 [compost metagenome]
MDEDEDYDIDYNDSEYDDGREVVYMDSGLNPWVTWGRAFGIVGVVFVLVWGLRGCYDSDKKLELEKAKIDAVHGAFYKDGAKYYREDNE